MKRYWIRAFFFLATWTLLASGVAALSLNEPESRPPERLAPVAPVAEDGTVELARPLPVPESKVEPALLKEVLQGDVGDQYRFIVEMVQQADLTSLPAELSLDERRQQVVGLLQGSARQSQADLLQFLAARRASGQVQRIQPFWIVNGLGVTADADTLFALASRPEVGIVRRDPWRQWTDPLPSQEDGINQPEGAVQWNIARVRADLAWSALGLDGAGVTVAIMDTGVDWQHPALQAQYRGYKPGGLVIHDGNWFCTTDEGYLYPVDGHGHGTHVAGTAVGGLDGDGRAIGVAPGASWIAVKMLSDGGYGYDSWIHAAFEWIMAPAGDPALAPDVINASWGSPDGWDEAFRSDLQALRLAGIVPVFSAGNNGPFASSLDSPGSYPEAFAVGASDDVDRVTSFSSRGPSPWDEVKPEVVAPGADIRSSLPGGTYGTADGTSMAAPHVAGLVALLRQADPTLTVDEIEMLLTTTAVALGGERPNNASGWGRIDAYQAAAVALQAGFVAGQVRSQQDQQPLHASIESFNHVGEQLAVVQTDTSGWYRMVLPEGRYDLKAKAFGYEPYIVTSVGVQETTTTTLDFVLSPLPSGKLWGQIRDAETGEAVSAMVSVEGAPAYTISDPQTGQYALSLPAGTYTILATVNGYRRHSVAGVEIVAGQDTQLDALLESAPTLLLVDSGLWYYDSQASYLEQALEDSGYVYDLWEVRRLPADRPGLEDLSPYEVTVWSSPLDSPGFIGAGHVISDYLGMGGKLLLTGQDVGYWDGGLDITGAAFYFSHFLQARAVDDDAGRSNLVGVPGDLLDGLSLTMNGPDSARNQLLPDVVELVDEHDAAIVGSYALGGDAALRSNGCQSYRVVYLAAGLEGLGDRSQRAEVMGRSLAWLGAPYPETGADLQPPRQEKVWLGSSEQGSTALTYAVELRNTGQFTDTFSLELSPSAWSTEVWDGSFSQTLTKSVALGVCQTQTVGIKVTVPPGVRWNASDTVTLTARSQADPARAAQATFASKAPAPILLVDDHSWFDMTDRYRAALEAKGLPYDVWRAGNAPNPDVNSPTLERLQRYAIVIWFTAYDWYATLTPTDEARLAAYLDGGGRFLLSSQDYLYTSRFTDFARHYLGVADYTESMTVTQVAGAVGSPIGDGLDSMDLAYPFRNWSDSLQGAPTARLAFWGQHGQPVALTREEAPWKTAFFAFPLETLQAGDMARVLGRTAGWLSPLGDSSFYVDRGSAAVGEELSYTLAIRNTGAAFVGPASLSNTLPLSTTLVEGSLEGPAQYDPETRRVTWWGSLNPGETIAIRYQLQIDAGLPDGTAIENVALLDDDGGLAVERTATSRVNAPDLSGSVKMIDAATAASGEVITYTLLLRNDGLQAAQAELVDPFPLRAIYVPGSAWASSGELNETAEVLNWTGMIPTGQAVTVTLPVRLEPASIGFYVLNRAELRDGWGSPYLLEAYTWVRARVFLPIVWKQY